MPGAGSLHRSPIPSGTAGIVLADRVSATGSVPVAVRWNVRPMLGTSQLRALTVDG